MWDKKPKIALIHYSGPPIIAGVENMIKSHARAFRFYKFPVHILVGAGEQFRKDIPLKVFKDFSPRNPLVLKIRKEYEEGKVSKNFYRLEEKIYDSLKRYLIKEKIEICIVHNVMTMHYNLALTSALSRLAKDLKNIRFIAWTHDSTFGDSYYKNIRLKKYKIYPWKLIREPQDGFEYVAISKFRARQLKNVFSKQRIKIKVIPDFIDFTKFFSFSSQIRRLIEETKIQEADLIGITPVRALERKNLELVVDIVREIVKRGINLKLIITAPLDFQLPQARKYLDKIIKKIKDLKLENYIIILSQYKFQDGTSFDLPRLTISDLYILADFLLLTSKVEGFGLPLLEAALAKIPIFCSNIRSFKEIGKNLIYYFNLNENPKNIAIEIINYSLKSRRYRFSHRIRKEYFFFKVFEQKIIPFIMGSNIKAVFVVVGLGEYAQTESFARVLFSYKWQVYYFTPSIRLYKIIKQGEFPVRFINSPYLLNKAIENSKANLLILGNSKTTLPYLLKRRPCNIDYIISLDSNWLFGQTKKYAVKKWIDKYITVMPPKVFRLGLKEYGGHYTIPPSYLNKIYSPGFIPSGMRILKRDKELFIQKNKIRSQYKIFAYFGKGITYRKYGRHYFKRIIQILDELSKSLDFVLIMYTPEILKKENYPWLKCFPWRGEKDMETAISIADLVIQHHGLGTLPKVIRHRRPVICFTFDKPKENIIHDPYYEIEVFVRLNLCKHLTISSSDLLIKETINNLLFNKEEIKKIKEAQKKIYKPGEENLYRYLKKQIIKIK